MYVRAISIGHAVPRIDFDAVVHSVFDSALNLKPKGEDRLLTLLASGEADLPQGIRLETPAGFSFKTLCCGTEASCGNGFLRFNGYPWTIDLQHAACWDEELPALHADMQSPRVVTAWTRTWQALNERQALYPDGLIARDLTGLEARSLSPWIQQASRCLRAVLQATQHCRAAPREALRGLIGLGPGLTPSGDDLLAGYLIGLCCTAGGKVERLRFLSLLGGAVRRLSAHTNDISRTYLLHAAHGHASSRLLDLAGVICRAEAETRILPTASAAMLLGHTSGMDAVTGLLIGLAVWDAPHLIELQGST